MGRILVFMLAILLFLPEIGSASQDGYMLGRKNRKDRNARNKANKINECRASLSGLYNCLQLYPRDRKGRLPQKDNAPGLRELLKNGATVNDFICVPYKGRTMKKLEDFSEERLPYLYFGGANIQPQQLKESPKRVLLCDKPETKHINALLADGTIVELQPKRYNRKIESCVDIIQLLDAMYNYDAKTLKSLLAKAKRMDENIFGKKPRNTSKR